MALPSTLFLIFFSTTLVFGHLLPAFPRTLGPWPTTPEEERKALTKHRQQRSMGSPQDDPDCQEGSPLGASYSGKVNVTASGRSCQVWSTSEPHEPKYTDMGKVGETEAGDHNYCRNPSGEFAGVWCYTTDPDKRWEHCSVSICVPTMLKVLDFSADNDQKPDSNAEYTTATLLDAGLLPESFTICSAFLVESWTTVFRSARMFTLLRKKNAILGIHHLICWSQLHAILSTA